MDTHQTVIFLVRHGQTDRPFVNEPLTDGERVLTEKGESQMAKVGEYLKSFAPEAIYSSPRKRTLQCSKILKEKAEIPGEIVEAMELYEIYSKEAYQALGKVMPSFLDQLVQKHSGKQVVCVSHEDVIEGTLIAYNLTSEEMDLPCQMADVYRLVFAGPVLVECLKLRPAKDVA